MCDFKNLFVMHIETAALTTGVAISFWAISAASASFSLASKDHVAAKPSDSLFASATATVFAIQMLNFAIPGTGSSGHVVGAVLLALFLGRKLALVSMGLILALQSLLFADGGLLALGANYFNMAVLPILVALPPLRKVINNGLALAFVASLVSAVAGALSATLQIGLFPNGTRGVWKVGSYACLACIPS